MYIHMWEGNENEENITENIEESLAMKRKYMKYIQTLLSREAIICNPDKLYISA